jgi:DNA gyrase subunit A
MKNNLLNELGTNFIEYAVAVNTDRAIPDAKSGLKPVAKRILYGAFDNGYSSNKVHVKCASIVGGVMADFHPHGDSSIYGALVRLSQPWVMRYPLIDFHGSNGNRDGDGPAAYRYTEARLAKLTEDGMLSGIKKNNVDFVPNYSETKNEPVTLPALFPNLLCKSVISSLKHNIAIISDATLMSNPSFLGTVWLSSESPVFTTLNCLSFKSTHLFHTTFSNPNSFPLYM